MVELKALVDAAPERARMGRRGAQTGPAGGGSGVRDRFLNNLVIDGEVAASRGGSEADKRSHVCGADEIHPGGGRRSVEKRGGLGGE